MLMKGFFRQVDDRIPVVKSTDKSSTSRKKRNVKSTVDPCEKCGLYKNAASPKMEYTGEGRESILIIAEAPGREEDKRGIQLVGDVGQFFRSKLNRYGLDLDLDFWKINAVNCRPPENKKPTKTQLKCCKPRIDKVIDELKPKFIWLMGDAALQSFFLSKRLKKINISGWRGICIPDRTVNSWVIPMYHPSFAYRAKGEGPEVVFDKDLKFAVSCLKTRNEFPELGDENSVVCTKDLGEILDFLEDVYNNASEIVFDYETSGLKPHREGHKIHSISIAVLSDEIEPFDGINSKWWTLSFPYQYPGMFSNIDIEEMREWLVKILGDSSIRKIAQNLPFEDSWSRRILSVVVKGWFWDTMVCTHVIEGKKVNGLKPQVYRRWGVEDYDEDVEKFIKAKDSNSNSFNKLHEVSIDDLLLYGGLDSQYEARLYDEQKKYLRWDERSKTFKLRLGNAFSFLLDGTVELADIRDNGINVDEDYYDELTEKLTKEMDELHEEIMSDPRILEFEKNYGTEFNHNSGKHLVYLLFEQEGLESDKLTDKGNKSVDEEVLNTLAEEEDLVVLKHIVRYRKLKKIRDTYLAQFRREVVGGRIYPFFHTTVAASYRSSSSNPNFQNIPNREAEARKLVRTGILPSKGNKLVSPDYGGIEVCIAACYTKDSTLVYELNHGLDMHAFQTQEIYVVDEAPNDVRKAVKNQFVFPEFYGSWFKSCAPNLWETCNTKTTVDDIKLVDHLVDKKIIKSRNDFRNFESHIENVERKFWDKYPEFKQWQEDTISFYKRHGYIELFHGFRRYGYLPRNKIINTPIQGTAFHCLLWSLCKINKEKREHKFNTKIIGQIHDEIVFDLVPSEEEEMLDIIREVMCNKIREEFDWIIVPLTIDIEMTGVDQPWFYKEKVT